MAEFGDPKTHDDHDDLIGFTSPSSLAGAERRPEPPVSPQEALTADVDDTHDDLFDDLASPPTEREAPVPESEPASVGLETTPASVSDDLGPLFGGATEPRPTAPSTPTQSRSFGQAALPVDAAPPQATPTPEWAREAVRPPRTQTSTAFGKSRRTEPPQGAMALYSVYALILFAVPTLGLSAFIALFAVTGRPGPDQPLAHSHFLFQQRTLWIAAVSAAVGVVLIAVNLGVFVLFIMAVWVLIRGTAGLIRLAAGRPVPNPKTLLI